MLFFLRVRNLACITAYLRRQTTSKLSRCYTLKPPAETRVQRRREQASQSGVTR